MQQSAYIIVRSRDRNIGQSPSPANIYINSSISYFSNTEIKSVEGESFECFYDVPNINIRNNVLLLDDGATSYPVTISEGVYNYLELAAALTIQLNTLGLGVFAVDYGVTVKNAFTMASPVPVSIVDFPEQKRDLGDMMGFVKDQTASSFLGSSPDLAYTRNIYVSSGALNNRKRIDDQASSPLYDNLMLVVPVYENSYVDVDQLQPRNIYYQPHNPKKINFDNAQAISNLDVTLYDDEGEILYVPSGSNCLNWRLNMSISRDL